jgi:hypothetical protein
MARYRPRFEALDRDIKVLFPDVFSDQARSKALADHARVALADGQKQNQSILGRVPPHDTYVDGKHNAAIETVRPEGRIVFEFELLDDVFAWIADMLVLNSPVGRGDDPRPGHPTLYASSHAFFADGQGVDPSKPVPPASEYVFVNVQPYARKIERGLSMQAPSGVYEVVANLANRRFGNLVRIRFGYRTPAFGAIDEWARTTKMPSPYRRGEKREEWLRRQPAIIISHHR